MDKLSLRRALYTDPASISPDALADAELQELQQQLLRQDEQLRQLLQLDVPASLADKVLFHQRLAQKNPRPNRWYWSVASAASVALVCSYLLWQAPVRPTDLGEHALRHVYHELASLQAAGTMSPQELTRLWSAEGLTTALDLPVRYARHCHIDGIRSLHLVVEYQGQAVTLFILPAAEQPRLNPGSQFADSRFIGQQQQWQQRPVLIVAEQPALLQQFSAELNKMPSRNT